jgi:hypothetical protein
MASQFPPEVERWRATVAKYFPPELVDKALWVIQHESVPPGNPTSIGDNGVAVGLFQIQSSDRWAGRPTKEQLLDPEFNIRYAAQNLGAASGKWSDWGEGVVDERGNRFGALGNNPFPGGTPMTDTATTGTATSYAQLVDRLNKLLMSPPPPGTDEYDTWLQEVTSIGNLARSFRPDTSEDPAVAAAAADFNRRVAAVQTGLQYDSTNLAHVVADIDRFLSGKEESRARAGLKQAQQDTVQKYGTAPGKNTFSANDLGAAFGVYADILGIDRNSQDFAKYGGTQYLDVEGDLSKYDSQFGVTGQLPTIPAMQTQPGQIPIPYNTPAGGSAALPGQGTATATTGTTGSPAERIAAGGPNAGGGPAAGPVSTSPGTIPVGGDGRSMGGSWTPNPDSNTWWWQYRQKPAVTYGPAQGL